MFTFLTGKVSVPNRLDPQLYCLLLNICFYVTAWPHGSTGDNCPSTKWNVMCRPCCEYHLIQCRCPSKGSRVGYTVPCCRNALDQCDPCIIHPGCSLFENCKTCHNGTWKANDDFFVNGKYCTECRQGWSGGDCKTCGGIIQRAQGHIALESYPTNARCEWTVQVQRGRTIELRFSLLSLEPDHNCRYDYVEARDGDDLSSPVIGRFCGDRLPPPIRSSGNLLHILFTSDGYNNLDGFVLTFQQSPGLSFPTAPVSRSALCEPPDTLLNGYVMPAYGLKEELVSVKYGCHQPFVLAGPQQSTCLPDGTWSGTRPTCVNGQTNRVRCAPPPKLLHGFHRAVAGAAGGDATIEFVCTNSYVLSGTHQSSCLSNGSWSSRPPKCVRACRQPRVSQLVRQRVVKPHLSSRQDPKQRAHLSSRYSVHDLLTSGFTPLTVDRQSSVERDDLPRGFHPVHTSIEYRCASPLYRHTGSSRRTCLKTGRWSGRHVSCSPVCGKLDTFSSHNLSDTQWPWHAAIYVRSPADHTDISLRSHHQEPTEESAFWFLACSGALLAQRSVLVAAQCVVDEDTRLPLQPARVKVVVGRKYQASMDRSNVQHHLRVSEILIHPEFHSAPESGVAVLTLKDKARISERVLPVCLPRMQGGEVAAQEAYTARWILPNDRRHPSRRSALSQTRTVELSDVSHCEKAFTHRGAHTAAISDNTLCVARKPSSPESPCPSGIPGLTTLPSGVSSTGGAASGQGETRWQLLALESFIREENCRQQTYTVQTRIGNFRDWIEKHMS